MSDEPELRRDPVTGRWVLIAPERARRPIALSDAGPHHRTNGERTPCPFCPGQEYDTPNETFAYREPGSAPNGPGWHLRVVPNKFPAVRCDPVTRRLTPQLVREDAALFASVPAYGVAEVLIECAEHISNPTLLSDGQLRDVFRAYRERMKTLSADPGLAAVSVFKNVGAEAGASLGHTHSQIIATAVVPELIRAELAGASEYFTRTGHCVFCDLAARELADGTRVVARSAHFVVVTAFAPRFGYEMWAIPLAHETRYESITDGETFELARLLKRVLRALDDVLHSPAYNWFLHTTPPRAGDLPSYHWHLEIVPRTSRPAGLEWGHGCNISTTSPEHAAAQLRAALPVVE